MQTKIINELYQVIMDENTTDSIIQNVGKVEVQLYITTGTAPTIKMQGIILNPGIAINRNEIPESGSVYAKAKGQSSVLITE